jgi:hypothetical protein
MIRTVPPTTRGQRTAPRGSGIVLAALLMALIAFCFVEMFEFARWLDQSDRFARATEASVLAATQSLSRIVVNDPYWGYVSLSDWPSVGSKTLAKDGKALPVTGINTLIATVRADLLVAKQLQDPYLQQLAEQDSEKLNETINLLNRTLENSLKPSTPGSKFVDMDGNVVKPFEEARHLFVSNLPANEQYQIENFQLHLGWLESGSSTTTHIPEPQVLSEVPNTLQVNHHYIAFKNVPAGGKSFHFAGLGKNTSLVQKDSFKAMTRNMPCSIVCLDTLSQVVASKALTGAKSYTIGTRRCAQPASIEETEPHGWFVLAFPDGRPQEISSIHNLLSSPKLSQAHTALFQSNKGDFPEEGGAELTPVEPNVALQEVVARSFFHWLRSNHGHVRLDSLSDNMDIDFGLFAKDLSPYKCYLLQFDDDGVLHIVVERRNPFERLTVAENQLYSYSPEPMQLSGSRWTVTTRDMVANLGVESGGKHGGQPLTGAPINWCVCDGYREVNLRKLSDAKRGIRAYIVGPTSSDGHITNEEASQFFIDNRTVVQKRLRSELYCGGLCAEVRLASIGR